MMHYPPKHIISAAAVVLNEDNKILLLRGPRRGWEMPGGQVEEGESLSAAAIRETKEETGIDIEVIRFCGIFQNVKGSICNTLFLGRPIGGEFRTSNESLEIGYFSLEETMNMVTWKNFKERIEYCINRQEPFLIEFNN
jgi:8-oxo-dGTP diphosphatase